MSELRLCKDCKYYRKDFYAHFVGVYNLDRCSNPVVTDDFVNGKESTYCSIAREGARCGKDANLWESRK